MFKFSRQLISIFYLGFSSGLPLALVGSTLQAWFATTHATLVSMGLLTLIGQPYVYKVFWAPLLDRYRLPGGRRRGWIMAMQISLAMTLFWMAQGNPQTNPIGLSLLALLAALFSATQDIAIDAYRTDCLSPEERGLGAALTMTGYRLAMIISGGIALIFANHYGWRLTYLLMAALMLGSVVITRLSPEPVVDVVPVSLQAAIIQPVKNFFQRPYAGIILIFIILYKFGGAFTVSLSTAFLIQALHFSLATIGMVNKIVALVAAITGGIVGGILLMRWPLFKALLIFGILQACCSLLFMTLALTGKNFTLLVITISADNFCSGMSAAALIAYLTGLCNKRFSATQFALFSAIAAMGRVFVGPLAGVTAAAWGWSNFFLLSFLLSVPGLALLWALRYRYDVNF